jgi:hypothetical protein
MKSSALAVSLCGVLAALLLAACRGAAVPVALPPTPTPAQLRLPDPAGLTPEQLTGAYYNGYLAYAGGTGEHRNPIVDGAFRTAGYVSAGLAQKIDGLRAANSLNYDPLLCAQDIPGRISVGPAAHDDGQARVPVTSDFAHHAFTVLLTKAGDRWQITDVKCSGPGSTETARATQAPAPAAGSGPTAGQAGVAGWRTYANVKHGFQIHYPAGWIFKELVADPNQPPIGPANVPLVVHFMPQTWADKLAEKGRPDPNGPVIAPFVLELSIGTLEEYRRAYPGPATESKAVSFNGHPAVREVEALNDEAHVIRYLFTNPGDPNRRLTFIDYTSGFSQRLKGNEAVAQQFDDMLPTLAWK